MKQIEYTEKQKIVIEVVEEFANSFQGNLYESQWKNLFAVKQDIFKKYGIVNKYQTLRDYIKNKRIGEH